MSAAYAAEAVPASAADDAETSLRLIDEGYRRLSAAYPDLRLEQTAEGEIIVMAPPYTETGRKNFKLVGQLDRWIEQGGGGEGFDSSSIFRLPNGAKRGPDLSWIEASRWEALPPELKGEFAQICPDFVLELRSETDRLPPLRRKMREYMENGARLGWLIDPRRRCIEVYRPGRDVEVLSDPPSVSGEDVLPGFTLYLTGIFT